MPSFLALSCLNSMGSSYNLLQMTLTPISHPYHICMTKTRTNETQLLGSPECASGSVRIKLVTVSEVLRLYSVYSTCHRNCSYYHSLWNHSAGAFILPDWSAAEVSWPYSLISSFPVFFILERNAIIQQIASFKNLSCLWFILILHLL